MGRNNKREKTSGRISRIVDIVELPALGGTFDGRRTQSKKFILTGRQRNDRYEKKIKI